jgi:hypothetical protein
LLTDPVLSHELCVALARHLLPSLGGWADRSGAPPIALRHRAKPPARQLLVRDCPVGGPFLARECFREPRTNSWHIGETPFKTATCTKTCGQTHRDAPPAGWRVADALGAAPT